VNFNLRSIIYVLPFLLLSSLFVFQSCKKEISSIGLDLKDREDLLDAFFTDSVTLIAYSVKEDTLNTTNLIYNYLGYLNDDIFGTTTAGIYTQLVPEGNSFSPGNYSKIDSIVLTLRYSGGFYGDTLNPFTIKIYELTEDILASETYYQNNSIEYNLDNLTYDSEFHLYPKPKTKVMVDSIKDPHVRIRLKDDLGQRFLDNKDNLKDSETFKSFFKGIYISAEPYQNNGSMVNFNLANLLSGIQIYYSNGEETRKFSLIMNNRETVRFSSYQHDYESGDPNFVSQVFKNDTAKGRDILYVQAMGGIKTKISFPHIKSLNGKKIVINKAELIITCAREQSTLFPSPEKMTIQGVNKEGKTVFLPDDALFTSDAYWGGGLKNNEYRFRISKYIQNIILHDSFQPFIYLVTNRAAADANRLLITGTDTLSPSRLRLELYYTEY